MPLHTGGMNTGGNHSHAAGFVQDLIIGWSNIDREGKGGKIVTLSLHCLLVVKALWIKTKQWNLEKKKPDLERLDVYLTCVVSVLALSLLDY